MKFWTLEEYQKFSEVMMEKPVYYYAFEVLYWLGLREGEGVGKLFRRLEGKLYFCSRCNYHLTF